MSLTLGEIAELVQGELHGEAGMLVPAVLGLDSLEPGALTFAENSETAAEAIELQAGALLVPAGVEPALPYVTVKQPRVAFAKALNAYHPPYFFAGGIHPQAHVHPTAQVVAGAYVGPCAYVGEGAVIAEGAQIYPRVLVGKNASVGAKTRLMPGVSLGEGAKIGSLGLVGSNTTIGAGTVIGDDVEIGARDRIGEDCRISSGVRIDNLSHIGDRAEVGHCAIVISHTLMDHDSKLGNYSIFAVQSYLAPGQSVGDGALMGGRSFVDRPIPPGQANWCGYPVKSMREDLKEHALRGRLQKNWDKICAMAEAVLS